MKILLFRAKYFVERFGANRNLNAKEEQATSNVTVAVAVTDAMLEWSTKRNERKTEMGTKHKNYHGDRRTPSSGFSQYLSNHWTDLYQI